MGLEPVTRTRDLCDTGKMLYQLSHEATHWERGQFIEFMCGFVAQLVEHRIPGSHRYRGGRGWGDSFSSSTQHISIASVAGVPFCRQRNQGVTLDPVKCATLEKSDNAINTENFGFVFEENLDRKTHSVLYYMPSCGYEFYLLVYISISHSCAAFTREPDIELNTRRQNSFISASGHVIFCLLYKRQWNNKPFHFNHDDGDLFTCEDNMFFSRLKIWSFRAKAQRVFHWCLYNKVLYYSFKIFSRFWFVKTTRIIHNKPAAVHQIW